MSHSSKDFFLPLSRYLPRCLLHSLPLYSTHGLFLFVSATALFTIRFTTLFATWRIDLFTTWCVNLSFIYVCRILPDIIYHNNDMIYNPSLQYHMVEPFDETSPSWKINVMLTFHSASSLISTWRTISPIVHTQKISVLAVAILFRLPHAPPTASRSETRKLDIIAADPQTAG